MKDITAETFEININNITGYFELLNIDNDYALDIIKSFPDGITTVENNTLIPQLWWGNLENPEIIILGKNPSYRKEDELDNRNEEFRNNVLIKNVSYFNRDNTLNLDILFKKYSHINVIKTWKRYLNYLDKEYYGKVAIYNMFGYYRTNLDKPNPSISHLSTNNQIRDELINKIIDNPNSVYFMWNGTKKLWKNILCTYDDKKSYIVEQILDNAKSLNEKNSRVPSFMNIKVKEE